MTANWLKDLNLKPRSNSVKTFKSYVDLGPEDKQGTTTRQDLSFKEYQEEVIFLLFCKEFI